MASGTSSLTLPVRGGGEVVVDAAARGMEPAPARRDAGAVGSRPQVAPTGGAGAAGDGAGKTASGRRGASPRAGHEWPGRTWGRQGQPRRAWWREQERRAARPAWPHSRA
jgi:hypothetical protein